MRQTQETVIARAEGQLVAGGHRENQSRSPQWQSMRQGLKAIRELVTFQIVTIIMGKKSGRAMGLKTATSNSLVLGNSQGALGPIRIQGMIFGIKKKKRAKYEAEKAEGRKL